MSSSPSPRTTISSNTLLDNSTNNDPNYPSWMTTTTSRTTTTATATTTSDDRQIQTHDKRSAAAGTEGEHDFLVRAEDDNDNDNDNDIEMQHTTATTAASQLLMGCGDKTLLCHLRFVNILDASLALILIIYGSLIHFGSAKALSRVCLLFGCGLMLSVMLSELSLKYSTCRRCGLWIGSYLAVALGIMYFILGFYILLGQQPITNYLSNHQKDLYIMNQNTIHNLVTVAGPWFFMMGIIMSIMEGTRFLIMKHVRQKLLLPTNNDLMGNGGLSRPLLLDGSEAAASEDDFFPIDESSLHSDPLWWAKSVSNMDGINNDDNDHRRRQDDDPLSHHEPNWVV